MKLDKYISLTSQYQKEFDSFQSKMFPIVMQWEGGGKLHKVSGDSGGWTIWGLTWNNLSDLFNDFEDFKNTTEDEASYIAFANYYLPIEANLAPYETQLYYFDMAYNMGTRRAIKYMQQCIGVQPDGIIGNITRSNMHLLTKDCLRTKRENYYTWLNNNRPQMSKFYKGWMNRSKAIYEYEY